MADKRKLVGSKPVIGIRPIIDGRKGPLDVRGSLEEQTMGMAMRAKVLFEENIRYSDGTPVKVVVADGTIGRVRESAACAEKFKHEGVEITLSVTPCWCYGSETMDMDPNTIKAVWGLNGTERPGAVYLASVLASYSQKGLPAFGIYGKDVQDADDENIPDDVREMLLRFARSAVAVTSLRGMSYLQIGATCMGIGGSIMDQDFMEGYLGMRVESIDEVEILRRMDKEIYDKEEFERALEWTKKYCKEGFDKNPDFAPDGKTPIKKDRATKDEQWEFTVKMYLIIKDLMRGNEKLEADFPEESIGHNAIAGGFQGQRQWTDHWPNCDYPEAFLSTTFDYDGAREPYVLATENDILNGICMLLQKQLTGRAPMFSDVRTCWSEDSVKRVANYELSGHAKEAEGFLHLINSGASALDFSCVTKNDKGDVELKKWWEVTEDDQQNMLEATTWNQADNGYFAGGGYSSRFLTNAEIPITMIRLNLVKGLGPFLQIAEGWTVKLPQEVTEKLWKRTDYTWPCTWFTPRVDKKEGSVFCNAYEVMRAWGANHGSSIYGHVGADLITLCSMLRIPVAMHNVPEDMIYRPSAWTAFGTKDKEGADFRACKNFGPLYKKY